MDAILRKCEYFFSDHSYRRIVDLGIFKISYIVLAILMPFKDNFAYNYRKIRNRNLAYVVTLLCVCLLMLSIVIFTLGKY